MISNNDTNSYAVMRDHMHPATKTQDSDRVCPTLVQCGRPDPQKPSMQDSGLSRLTRPDNGGRFFKLI